jgi:thioredoxin-like negative regulator of GroEL
LPLPAGSYRQILATEPDNLEAKIGLSEVLYWTGNSEAAAATLKGVPEDKLDDKGKLMLADLFVAKKPKLSPWGYAARIDANRQILTERYSSFL